MTLFKFYHFEFTVKLDKSYDGSMYTTFTLHSKNFRQKTKKMEESSQKIF